MEGVVQVQKLVYFEDSGGADLEWLNGSRMEEDYLSQDQLIVFPVIVFAECQVVGPVDFAQVSLKGSLSLPVPPKHTCESTK